MAENPKRHPSCFGILDSVFPSGPDGLRHSPEKCMVCSLKTECLRNAIKGSSGMKVEEEKLERTYKAGRISFLKRWSRKKQMEKFKKNIK